VSQQLKIDVTIAFMRDTEAAAATFAGLAPANGMAVVMLGTATGVGFVPGGEGYRPLTSDFEVFSKANGLAFSEK
jgi:hypothetical protein